LVRFFVGRAPGELRFDVAHHCW